MHAIPVRRMEFDIPTADDFDPKWLANDILQSYMSTGISLYVAYLEPFLVKAMRCVLDQIEDDEMRKMSIGSRARRPSTTCSMSDSTPPFWGRDTRACRNGSIA